MKPRFMRSAFTLIELILVIAILALVASIGIGKFGDLRAKSARRVNVYNMQQLTRAAQTYVMSLDSFSGIFDKMESLLDIDEGGKWTGTPGTYDWTLNSLTAIPGIYMGPKRVSDIKNASGDGPDTTNQTLDQQRKQNQGLTAGLQNKLGVYYLTEANVKKFKEGGISDYLLHNYVAGQSALFGFTENEDGTPLENGGPGFRADMSAFYKVALTNGSPVAVLNPSKSADVYRALGVDLGLTKEQQALTPEEIVSQGLLTHRLIVFGLGRTSTFARNALDSVPRCEVVGKEYYRNYLMVFKQRIGGNSPQTLVFAGILDANGKAIEGARYDMDWAAD